MGGRAITALGLLISAALIGYLAWTFDLSAVAAAWAMANPLWLVLAALLYSALFPLRGLRWSIILRRVLPVKPSLATEIFAIGFLANNVMPLRLGDVARALVLARKEKVAASSTFSTVLLERIFDGLTVVAMLLAVLALAPPTASSLVLDGMIALMAVAFPSAVAVCALIAWNERRAFALAAWALRPLPARFSGRAQRIITKLAAGLGTLRSRKDTIQVGALSLLIWTIEVGVYLLAERAFGLNLGPTAMVVVMAVLTLGLTVPSAPAFVGVFEGLVIAALGLYAIDGPVALAFAAAMHVIHFVPGSLLGALFAARLGLRLGEIRRAAEAEAPAT